MASLSSVLAWKHSGVSGIVVSNDVILQWPLGASPTQGEIDTWTTEYESYIAVRNAEKADYKTHIEAYTGTTINIPDVVSRITRMLN